MALTVRYVVSVSFRALIAVILELGGAQTLQPVPLHRVVPREELIDQQAIALAHPLNCDYAALHRCDDRGFPPPSPALGVGRRQVTKSFVNPPQNLAFRRALSIMFLAMTGTIFSQSPSGSGRFRPHCTAAGLICLIDLAARCADWARGPLLWYFADGVPTSAPGQYVEPRMNSR